MGHVSTTRRFSLPAATAGATIVGEVSRHWQYGTDSAGEIALLLIAVEIVYFVVSIAYTIWKWVRGEKKAVTVHRNEWRSKTRERVVQRRQAR